MLRVLTDRELEFSTLFCTDRLVFLGFTDAVTDAANFSRAEPALLLGVRVLKRMIRCARLAEDKPEFAEKSKVVKKVVKNAAIAFYSSQRAAVPAPAIQDGSMWEQVTAFGPLDDRKMRLLIDVFPVFWKGGIKLLFPIFFQNPAVSSLFNRTVLKHLARLLVADPGKFVTFLSSLGAAELIVTKWPPSMSPLNRETRDRPDPTLLFNPQVLQLAQLITFGGTKWPRPYRPPDDPHEPARPPRQAVPEPPGDKFISEYEKYSEWARDVLFPFYTVMVREFEERMRDS
jgi:hypothetical protein